MAQLLGIDVSNWQTVEAVDEALDFVIVKATQGTNFVNPICDQQYQRARSQGKLRGFYHYASGGDPIAEANFFVDNCENYFEHAIPVLDWEEYQNPRFYEHASWCKKFLDHVYARTGVRPLIYMSASVTTMADWSSVAKDYGLWVAGYPDLRDSWDIPDFPYDIPYWSVIAIWQYTNSNGRLDRNVAFMDKEAWKKYVNPSYKAPEPQPAPKPVEKPVEKVEEPKKEVEVQEVKVEEPKTEEKTEPVVETPAYKWATAEQYSDILAKITASVELVEKEAKTHGFKIRMSSKVYDALKVVVAVVLPTISALYLGLANIWGFGFGEQVDQTVQLAITVINAVLGIAIIKSSSDYHKENKNDN